MSRGAITTQVVLEMISPKGILQAVTEGAELMILPELYVRLTLAGSGLRTIDLYGPVPHHSMGLAYQGNRYQMPEGRHPLLNDHDPPPRPSKAQSPQHCDGWIRVRE
jgi:DNA-binding transcriptional LysR family regulator